jgi:ribosome-associated toxin RatA of RatAB toxin-antitoxin module
MVTSEVRAVRGLIMNVMPERRLEAQASIRLDRQSVFDWVADHRNVPRVLPGVARWDPVGPQTRGVGARFGVELRAVGLAMTMWLVLDRWDEPATIGWHSYAGLIRQRGVWKFAPEEGGTIVTLTVAYFPPGGRAGAVFAAGLERGVRSRLEQALQDMAGLLEIDS